MEPTEYALMDATEDRMWWYRAMHARVLDALPHAAIGHLPLLDAGCGTGGFLARFRAARPQDAAVGVEYFPTAARRAAAKSGCPVAVGSVNALPFADASFGAVVSLDVLCHRAVVPETALAEMARVLVPGGVLVLNLPAYQWLSSAHDVRVHNARRFTARGAATLLAAAGLVDIRPRYWNALLLPLMILQRKVLARGSDHESDVTDFSPWLDRTLQRMLALERRLAGSGASFPAGGSVLATATRR